MQPRCSTCWAIDNLTKCSRDSKLPNEPTTFPSTKTSHAENLLALHKYRPRMCERPKIELAASSQFGALTVYNSETSALFLNLTRPTLDSLDKGLRKNALSSVDIYIGPKSPVGQESNWIQTPAGKSWFPWFRFYGPEKAPFDKSWTMPDIVAVPSLETQQRRLVLVY
jgi:hypothetical protein